MGMQPGPSASGLICTRPVIKDFAYCVPFLAKSSSAFAHSGKVTSSRLRTRVVDGDGKRVAHSAASRVLQVMPELL